MLLVLETEDLQKILDPSKRSPEEVAADRAFLKEVREFGRTLVINPMPAPRPAPAHD